MGMAGWVLQQVRRDGDGVLMGQQFLEVGVATDAADQVGVPVVEEKPVANLRRAMFG